RAYGGPLEILASDSIISRLLAQNVRHPGLSHIFGELLTHGHGNEIYLRAAAEHAGRSVFETARAYPRAVLLGIVRTDGRKLTPLLNPAADTVLEHDDRLVLLAHSIKATTSSPAEAPPRPPPPVRRIPPGTSGGTLRVLVPGW